MNDFKVKNFFRLLSIQTHLTQDLLNEELKCLRQQEKCLFAEDVKEAKLKKKNETHTKLIATGKTL